MGVWLSNFSTMVLFRNQERKYCDLVMYLVQERKKNIEDNNN